MEFNTTLWEEAENDFQKWLSDSEFAGNELTGIIQAAFLINRKKLHESMTNLQNNSLQFLKGKGFVNEPDFLYDPSMHIMLSIAEPRDEQEAKRWENERIQRNLKRNKEIVNAILSGNQLVINNMYEVEFPKIVRLIIKNSGNIENAKDVFQDGLVILLENIFHKKVDLTDRLETYLYGICRLLWQNQLRKKRKNVILRNDFSYSNYDFGFTDIEATSNNDDKISKIIDSMGNPCKQLIEYYYYRNMSWDEIAEQLDYASAGSARNQKYKCLERIRKQLV